MLSQQACLKLLDVSVLLLQLSLAFFDLVYLPQHHMCDCSGYDWPEHSYCAVLVTQRFPGHKDVSLADLPQHHMCDFSRYDWPEHNSCAVLVTRRFPGHDNMSLANLPQHHMCDTLTGFLHLPITHHWVS